MSSRDLSRAMKLTLYKALILPVLLYGAEALSNTDVAALGVFARKVLLKIFGPVRFSNDYRIRTNRELYELINNVDVAKRINDQRFRWLGHVVRMDEDAPPRRVFDAVVGGHRRVGRPRTRWKDQVEEASNAVTNWRRRAQSRGAWREALRQADPNNQLLMAT